MSNDNSSTGRLIPASIMEFSRYAKNLAWLLETPLHFAQDLLTHCYRFGSVHELRSAIPAADEPEKPTGPFDSPRLRPPFYSDADEAPFSEVNRLAPLSAREALLMRYSMRVLRMRDEKDGRLRRRHYAVLDGAFFSVPSVHRKHFAALKAGILAMEGTPAVREEYLERHWPPAFWSYLEGTHLLDFDPRPGLSELQDACKFADQGQAEDFAHLFCATAAHRAPAIFLEMAGQAPQPPDPALPDYSGEWTYLVAEGDPSVDSSQPGLFSFYDGEDWLDTASAVLPPNLPEDEADRLIELGPKNLADSPPPGAPERLLAVARQWRLHQLRTLSQAYVDSDYVRRSFGRSTEAFWPGTPGNTVEEVSPFVLHISRSAPSLMLYAEFTECKVDDSDVYQLWKLRTLLTRTAPDEPEDVVGCMCGWLVVLANDKFAADGDMLLEEVQHADPLLAQGVEAFIRGYLYNAGHRDVTAFVNSRWQNSLVITTIAFRDKYKGLGLMPLALSGFAGLHQDAPYTDHPVQWLEDADFERKSGNEEEPEIDVEITTPGVFLVPAQRENRRLRSYLMNLEPPDPGLAMDEQIDVFPFHVEGPVPSSDD
ncbi:hypothetical protein [Agrobacterium tumefaciens]|uniref:hypothetical protein n=1 Tax=Agrobacterium tumefaciens TaxID=358 RepID=UPI001573447C|nr:hypothetical protein [Agrobacterium tumefaciens]NTB05880.1 hypothetical protein [Agrobacterium tumefaciens]